MKKKLVKKLKLRFLIICIITLVFMSLDLKFAEKKSYLNIKINNALSKNISKYDENGEKLVLRNELWEQMNEHVFFKRSSAFYLADYNRLKILYLSRVGINTSFSALIKVSYNSTHLKSFMIKKGEIKAQHPWIFNELNALDFNFSLLNYIDVRTYDDLVKNGLYKFYLFINDPNRASSKTVYPIEIKIKYIRTRNNQTKTGSIICSKCYYFKEDEYKELVWWLEINKRIGYEKIVFCNQSIPNTLQFNAIFKKYEHFIELKQMKTFPNFINEKNLSFHSHNYFTSYSDLKSYGVFDPYLRDVYDVLHENECYLENADKYEHIAVYDNDEAIIPKILNHYDAYYYVIYFKKDSNSSIYDLGANCKQTHYNKIDNYLNSIKRNVNLYFVMGFYLSNKISAKIFREFELFFNSNSNYSNKTNEYVINVIDLEPSSTDHYQNNYTFIIRDEMEFIYAKNLLYIYKNFIENSVDFKLNETSKFERVFYLAGELSYKYSGKTIHHTDTSLGLSVHFPVDSNYDWVELNVGHSSHFRNKFQVTVQNMSVLELLLDFSYINCYYRPILKEIKI